MGAFALKGRGLFQSALLFFLIVAFAYPLPAHSGSNSPGDVFRKDPGPLPGGIFYWGKTALEHFSIAISSDRSEKCLSLMDVRLSELSKMALLNRTEGLDSLVSEYSFLSETYRTGLEKPESFSRHVRNLEILGESLETARSPLSEGSRLMFASTLSLIRRKASLAGTVRGKESFLSPLRLKAENDLALARSALERASFLSEGGVPEISALKDRLKAAEILMREGEYISSSIVSIEVANSSSALFP